jgi:hypothetical protein
MAQVLQLSDEDALLLMFVLDTTVEEWKDKEESNVDFITHDRTFKSAEEMLTVVGDIKGMNKRLEAIRDRIAEQRSV